MQKKNESYHALPVITSLALNLFPCSWIESAGEHLISSLRYIYNTCIWLWLKKRLWIVPRWSIWIESMDRLWVSTLDPDLEFWALARLIQTMHKKERVEFARTASNHLTLLPDFVHHESRITWEVNTSPKDFLQNNRLYGDGRLNLWKPWILTQYHPILSIFADVSLLKFQPGQVTPWRWWPPPRRDLRGRGALPTHSWWPWESFCLLTSWEVAPARENPWGKNEHQIIEPVTKFMGFHGD